jgi:hypothetical protein
VGVLLQKIFSLGMATYCTSIKKKLKKKGLIILHVIDNIKWQYRVLQFNSAYKRAAPGIKTDLRDTGFGGTDWINLAKCSRQFGVL